MTTEKIPAAQPQAADTDEVLALAESLVAAVDIVIHELARQALDVVSVSPKRAAAMLKLAATTQTVVHKVRDQLKADQQAIENKVETDDEWRRRFVREKLEEWKRQAAESEEADRARRQREDAERAEARRQRREKERQSDP